MGATDLIEASMDYLGVIVVLFPICYKFGRNFNDEKWNIVSTVLPVGLVPLACAAFVIFSPRNEAGALVYAQEFVVATVVSFWALSCFMLARKLFTYLTSYQVVCFFTYFLLMKIFGIGYSKQLVVYSVISFSLGLFVLIRFRRITDQNLVDNRE